MSEDDTAGAGPIVNDPPPASTATGDTAVAAADRPLQRLLAAGRVGWAVIWVAGLAAIGLVIGLMVPPVAAELPRLADTASEGVGEVTRFLDAGPFGLDLGGVAGLIDRAREQLGDLGELAGPALATAMAALEIVVATVLLALPLGVLALFGGLFPIVGAVTAGALAVLVALAHGGLVLGPVVLALIVAVQQVEGNVLEPLILSQVVKPPALVVVLVVTAGAITFGVLGSFLAVPVTAVAAHVARSWRGTPDSRVPVHGPRGTGSAGPGPG